MSWGADRRQLPRRERGAVLLILLAAVSMGAAYLFVSEHGRGNLQAQRERRTLAAMAEAREALVGFASANGRLPRPAVSATNGAERGLPCASDAQCTGFIPWVTLGIAPLDAWGKLLRYSVTPVYTEIPVSRVSAVGTKTVLTRTSGGTIHYLAGNPACTLASPCLAAVVYSAGRDNFGTGEQGVAMPNTSATNVDEAANDVATLNFMSRARSGDPAAPGGEFDDLVSFIATEPLYVQMGKAGVLP